MNRDDLQNIALLKQQLLQLIQGRQTALAHDMALKPPAQRLAGQQTLPLLVEGI